jgi:hypothetical protein
MAAILRDVTQRFNEMKAIREQRAAGLNSPPANDMDKR